MNRRQKIIVSVTGIFLVLLLLVGLTYAYFLTQINGNNNEKSISVTTANLALVYNDGNGIIEPKDKIVPDTTIASKTFTVKNEGNKETNYVVVIEDVSVTYAETVEVNGETHTEGDATTFESNDFVYTLTCTSDVANNECNGIEEEVVFPINGGYLVLNDIKVNETQTYSLKLKYKETGVDQSNDMNKTLTAKVNIENAVEKNPYRGNTKSLAYNIINNAENVTADEKGNGYAELVATPPTSVANEISGADESVLSIAQDDFGVSYYYRGNVTNNYVNFAGMCWKAIRIDGTGNTKLILEDQYAECDDTTENDKNSDSVVYTGDWSVGAGPYGSNTLDVSTEIEVTDEETGETTTVTATNTGVIVHDFYQNSTTTLRGYLQTFQEDKLTSYYDKLVSGNWCSGDNAYELSTNEEGKVTEYNLLDMTTDLDGNGILDSLQSKYAQKKEFYYSVFYRLFSAQINLGSNIPTFKCDGNTFEYIDINRTLPMYAGAITGDEIAYAGGYFASDNANFYLRSTKAYSGLSLSRYRYSESNGMNYDMNIVLRSEGQFTNDVVSSAYNGNIRPVIVLNSNNTISSGTGSITDPYVIG